MSTLVERKISISSEAQSTWRTEYCEVHGDSPLSETKNNSALIVPQLPLTGHNNLLLCSQEVVPGNYPGEG
jgi:hypothetical protein